MVRRLTVVAGFALLLLPAPAQQPSPPLPAAFDPAAVAEEVQAFYAVYWKAWDDRNIRGVADGLGADFAGFLYANQQVAQLNKSTAVAGISQFFDALGSRQTRWGRSLLSVVPRSPTEAVAAVRSDFALREGGGETELTLEVLRKGVDGRWRLVRKWSEKTPF